MKHLFAPGRIPVLLALVLLFALVPAALNARSKKIDRDSDGWNDEQEARFGTNAADPQSHPFSGRIYENTVWHKSDSPLWIGGDVIIEENARLTIEPGTRIIATSRDHHPSRAGKDPKKPELIVFGEIIADGIDEPIEMTGLGGISFMELSRNATVTPKGQYMLGSIIRGCKIINSNYGVDCFGAFPYVQGNTIQTIKPAFFQTFIYLGIILALVFNAFKTNDPRALFKGAAVDFGKGMAFTVVGGGILYLFGMVSF